MTAKTFPRSRCGPAKTLECRGNLHTATGSARGEFSRPVKSVANWGRKKAGRGANRTGVIHEGDLMDTSIVPNPDLTNQSCCSERRRARVRSLPGYSARGSLAAALADVAHSSAQNSTVGL